MAARAQAGGPRDPPRRAEGRGRAILISERAEHQHGLLEAGYEVTYLALNQMLGETSKYHLSLLRSIYYSLLWIVTPARTRGDRGFAVSKARWDGDRG